MKKLKAFTLLELVFTMVLMSIVAGMGYEALHYTRVQFHNFKSKGEQVLSANVLYSQLSHDIDRATEVSPNNSSILLSGIWDQPVQYVFDEEYVIRSIEDKEDTFFVGTEDVQFRFDGTQQFLSNQLIDDIRFTGYLNDQPLAFHFHKDYAADLLMKREEAMQ